MTLTESSSWVASRLASEQECGAWGSSTIHLVELEPFGAEISGVDLAEPLGPAELSRIRALLDEHFLLVARGQQLGEDDQVRLIRDLCPDGPVKDEIGKGTAFSYVSNARPDGIFGDGAITFHSDFSFTTKPDRITSLYGAEVEAGAADTEFTSGARAFRVLPDRLRDRLRTLNVINAADSTTGNNYVVRLPEYNLPDRQDLSGRSYDEVVRARWPAILENSRGDPFVFINEQHTHHFEGVPLDEGRQLLKDIYSYLYADANICRHHWADRDLVVWDNLAVSHGRRATPTTLATRTLHRVVVGEVNVPTMFDFSQPGVV